MISVKNFVIYKILKLKLTFHLTKYIVNIVTKEQTEFIWSGKVSRVKPKGNNCAASVLVRLNNPNPPGNMATWSETKQNETEPVAWLRY